MMSHKSCVPVVAFCSVILVAISVAGLHSITCYTSDTPESCRERGLYYQENVKFDGNCPGCVHLAGLGESCTSGSCQPGYMCNVTNVYNPTCIKDANQVCAWATLNAKPGAWIPDCTSDGLYAKKQCKGDRLSGRCFCYDPLGNRIFGEAQWKDAGNMTCDCNRLVWDLQQTRNDVTIHCTEQGEFEELQCDDGVCWCARASTGEAYTPIVSDQAMKALPCYEESKHGEKYLRKCDSIHNAQQETTNLLDAHGTTNIGFNDVFCNYDGSYSRVQNSPTGNGRLCVYKDKTQINEFTIEANVKDVTCNCAYDKYVAEGVFNRQCDRNGDYEIEQHAGGQTFCVDRDGFFTKAPPC